jgi:hypothetical protein
MELKLVPIEGEKVLTEEEKERIKRRARPISPEVIRRFSDAEQKEMRFFLASLIVFTEQFHHDLAQIEEHKDNQEKIHHRPWQNSSNFWNYIQWNPGMSMN